MNKSTKELLAVTEPPTAKQEYHGNGEKAWYGPDIYHARENGHTIKATQTSHRYSYRWHKTKTIYEIDGTTYTHRSTFKAALRRIAGVNC